MKLLVAMDMAILAIGIGRPKLPFQHASLTLSTSKACIFTHPFERTSGGALLVLLGNVMNNSLSARWQELIKKSERTIERLAPNSSIFLLK